MDWLTFVVEMTKALAWPVMLGIVLLAFRKTLPILVDRVRTLRYGGFEAAFAEQALEVAERISETPAPPASTAANPGDELLGLARQSPNAAVLEAWRRIERRLRQLTEKHLANVGSIPPSQLIDSLQGAKIISSETAHALYGLRELRNLAVHAPEEKLSAQKAIDYITYVSAMLLSLKAAG